MPVLDDSKVAEATRFKGLEIELHRFSGARVLRVVHPERQEIDEHRHDWAYIGLYTLGRYHEIYDGGEALMSSPSVVLHPAGRPHADLVGNDGLETLTIEFDRAWLRLHGLESPLDRSRVWSGGEVALQGRRLAQTLSQPAISEEQIGHATAQFLHFAFHSEDSIVPTWVEKVTGAFGASAAPSTKEIARTLDLHPAWLARAYRAATGEGLQETARRKRVERAVALLRGSNLAASEIALAAGFCDQSHMNRGFLATLGRTPIAVRAERHPAAAQIR
jgi:AraC family transcriptional regulator